MKRLRVLSLVALAALLVALPACTSQQKKPMRSEPAPAANDGMKMEEKPMAMDHMGHTGSWMEGDMMVRALAIPTGEISTSTVLIEKRAPAEVTLGSEFDYTLVVKNLTNESLEDVAVMERIPGGMNIVSSDPSFSKTSDGKYQWVLGNLEPGAPATIRVRGVATQLGDHTYCAEVTYNQLACVTTRVVEPNLTMTKTMTFADGSKDGLVCDPVVVTITVHNTGTGAARNVVVRDNLPTGMVSETGQASMQWDVGSLNAGESREIRFNARANSTGDHTNTAEATADAGLNASASDSIVARRPALTIDKTGPAKIYQNKTATYEITVRNTGNGVARDTIVEDVLPAGSTYVSSQGGNLQGNTVVWNLGALQPDESRTMSVVVRAGASNMRNVARATAYCAEAVSDEVLTEVVGIPEILLEVVDINPPIPVGETVVYEITATNQGSAPGTNIVITTELEDTMEFVEAGGATSHTASGMNVNFAALPSLAPGAKAVWTVRVRAKAAGDVRFKVSMQTDQIGRPVTETEATNFYN
ncbi:MAG: CARDB domain-containing protein [Planctomycetota bacterium]